MERIEIGGDWTGRALRGKRVETASFRVGPAALSHPFAELSASAPFGTPPFRVFLNGRAVPGAEAGFGGAEVRDLLKRGTNSVSVEFDVPELPPGTVPPRISILAWRGARVAEIGFGQKHSAPGGGNVELLAGGWIECEEGVDPSTLRLRLRVFDPDGAEVGAASAEPGAEGSFHASVVLENPPLWRLAGAGGGAMHSVEAALLSEDGGILHEIRRRVGLRTLRSETRPDGSRVLCCNGVETFARGAEWEPWCGADAIAAAADASFNALRLPPGAPLPPDSFFEACDEAGIAVLGAAGAAEGGESGDGGGEDADPGAGAAADAMLLHPCIPDNPLAEPDDDTGFETVRSVVSWSAPETLEAEVPGALDALNGPEMTARTSLRGGTPALAAAVLGSWPMPRTPEGWVRLSQIAQASEVRRRVAAARVAFALRGRRDRSGSAAPTGFFWAPLQSARAGADAASLDSAGLWKALHHEAARSFAPEAVFALRDAPDSPVRAFRVSDGPGPGRSAEFAWRLTAMDGETLAAASRPLGPAAPGAEPLPLPDISPFFARRGRADLVLWLALRDPEGCVVSRDFALFAPPRALRLQDPELQYDVSALEDQGGEQVFRVSVSASAPAFGVFVETPGLPSICDESCFALDPDETIDVHVATLGRAGEAEFRAALRVRSLFDL